MSIEQHISDNGGSIRAKTLKEQTPNPYYELRKAISDGYVVRREISGHSVLITDLEKSVCDAVKFRNKVGIDVCAEILHSYLRRKDKSITKLMAYAAQMRIGGTMNKYLEMWV